MSNTSSDNSPLYTFYRKHRVLCNALLMCVVIVFLGFFSLFFIDVWTNHGNTTTVPEVRKKSYSEAVEALKKANLDVEIADSIYDTNLSPGQVKEVWPRPGANVKPGRTVFLTINSFQPQKVTVTMPLTGVSSRQAITYLESLNIKNIRIAYVPSNFPDLVEGAKYKGKSIVPGMQIPVNANVVLEVGNIPAGERPQPTNKSTTTTAKDSETAAPTEATPAAETPKAEEPAKKEPAPQPEHNATPSEPKTSSPDVFD